MNYQDVTDQLQNYFKLINYDCGNHSLEIAKTCKDKFVLRFAPDDPKQNIIFNKFYKIKEFLEKLLVKEINYMVKEEFDEDSIGDDYISAKWYFPKGMYLCMENSVNIMDEDGATEYAFYLSRESKHTGSATWINSKIQHCQLTFTIIESDLIDENDNFNNKMFNFIISLIKDSLDHIYFTDK